MHVLEPGMWAVDAKREHGALQIKADGGEGKGGEVKGLVEPGRLEGTFGGPTRRGE